MIVISVGVDGDGWRVVRLGDTVSGRDRWMMGVDMVNYATAVPRFLWWGFKRAGWVERAIVVTSALLLLGLVWPADESDALQGSHRWKSSSVDFHLDGGGWSGASTAYANAVRRADNEWRDNTDWDPTVVSSSVGNDIHWGDDPVANSGSWTNCEAPTGSNGDWAIECTKTRSGFISESDIAFNEDKAWGSNGDLVQGVATHELGHSGGLRHDLPFLDADGNVLNANCDPSLDSRWTMCGVWNASNVADAASLENNDEADANAMY